MSTDVYGDPIVRDRDRYSSAELIDTSVDLRCEIIGGVISLLVIGGVVIYWLNAV